MKQQIYSVRTDGSNLLVYKDGKPPVKKSLQSSSSTPFDFSTIGYTGEEESLKSDLAYSKELYDAWDPKSTYISGFELDSKLRYLPKIDTSNVRRMDYAFFGDTNLSVIPLIDTSNVKSMDGTFENCSSLATIPELDTSKVELLIMFSGCSSLTSLPKLNMSSAMYIVNTFANCTSLKTVGGFTNLGQAFTSDQTLDMSSCPLSSESVTNIANTVYNMNNNKLGGSAILMLSSSVYDKLTDVQKALFTIKNWTITK